MPPSSAKAAQGGVDEAIMQPAMEGLTDRRSECGVLDRLLGAIRTDEARALVVRGEAGMGKTALLEYLAERAAGYRVARAVGVQSEMELAFAGLHQLCAPMLDRADRLPVPQRDALRIAFGLSAGPAPERFLVGLAVLSLMSEVAGKRPLLCIIDDVQWLDRASAQVLGFVARRLGADPVGLVFAARVPGEELSGLPELLVEGLPEQDARALLDSALTGSLDTQVRDRILAETRGNPLALLELPRGAAPRRADRRELPAAAGGFAGADEAAAPAGGGRSIRGSAAGVASRGAAGPPGGRMRVGGGGGPGGIQPLGTVSPSADTFGGVPVGFDAAKTARARSAGGGHRSGART